MSYKRLQGKKPVILELLEEDNDKKEWLVLTLRCSIIVTPEAKQLYMRA